MLSSPSCAVCGTERQVQLGVKFGSKRVEPRSGSSRPQAVSAGSAPRPTPAAHPLLLCYARRLLRGDSPVSAQFVTADRRAPTPVFFFRDHSLGIIGRGDVTEVKSGPGFQKADGSELVAVMRRWSLKRDYARRHGYRRSTSAQEDLIRDPEIDAVYVE